MDKVKKFAPLGAAVLAFVAVLMIFVAAVGGKGMDAADAYTGLQVVFGYKETYGSLSYEILSFSFVNLLPYLFAIAGIACSVLSFLKADMKIFSYAAIACFALAAVFFFLPIAGLQAPVFKEASAEEIAKMKENLVLCAGPIVSGVCAILATLCAAAPVVLEKLGK